jgi:hypothetical protein
MLSAFDTTEMLKSEYDVGDDLEEAMTEGSNAAAKNMENEMTTRRRTANDFILNTTHFA